MKHETPRHKVSLIKYLVLSIVLTTVGVIPLLFGAIDSDWPIFYLGLALIIVGTAIMMAVSILIVFHVPHLEEGTLPKENEPGTLYADELVRLTDDGIFFLRSTIRSNSVRMVPYLSIEGVQVLEPSVGTGKWRIWGSGGSGVWFLWDGHRPSRDRIFIATLKNERTKLGFTAVNSGQVETILRMKGLLKLS